MKVIKDIKTWLEVRSEICATVGFVPTMGALHAGHVSLLERSVAEVEVTVLSIYVNPTQFNNPDDLANYPDTLDADLAWAEKVGVDYVILPRYEDMYADGFRYQVNESQFSLGLCGGNRPGHFTGVLTVVMKLLNLVAPHRAYFGKKDHQQYALIKDMCAAFFMNVEIVGCDTIREADGLAMSSRNKLLDDRARLRAPQLYQVLRSAVDDYAARERLVQLGFSVDYVETVNGRRFGAVVMTVGEHTVRLIDNVIVPSTHGPIRNSTDTNMQREANAVR